MRVLVVEPERRPEVKEIDGSLRSMQEVVGGWIQALFPFDEPLALVCNDEGKRLKHPDMSTIPQRAHKTKPPESGLN